jgi:hypothetical protein
MHPISLYTPVEGSQEYRLRGTNQQTDTGLLWMPPSYRANPRGLPGASSTLRINGGLGVGYFSLHNRSGVATTSWGIGVRVPNHLWIAGQWTDATTTYTDDTASAQDTTTNDVALETAATANDGFVVASRVPFNCISLNISTASVKGTTVARALRLSNAAGSAWATAITTADVPIFDGAADDMATGENLIAFIPPSEWGKSSSLATGLRDGFYAANVRATDAPDTTAALARAIELWRIFFITEAVSDNGTLSQDFGAKEFPMAWDAVEGFYGDGFAPLFGTATATNEQNRVTALIRAL